MLLPLNLTPVAHRVPEIGSLLTLPFRLETIPYAVRETSPRVPVLMAVVASSVALWSMKATGTGDAGVLRALPLGSTREHACRSRREVPGDGRR